ncbi:MAG: ECF-type sigma factor [Gemmatimonas sp.]
MAAAAVTMRNILVDRARRRLAEKRGGALCIVPLDEHLSVAVESEPDILLELNVALDRLAALEPRLARVIECRFFDGMSDQEIAAAVGVTDRTVRRDLAKARGLLFHMLRPPSSGDGGGSSVDDAA